jgi:hypothetical protein
MKSYQSAPSRFVTLLIMMVGFLGPGTEALAESNGGRCSNRTLWGDYGGPVEGVLIVPGPGQLPFRAVVMNHFDGRGSFTAVEHVVVNGVPVNPTTPWTPATGTYTVNPDCTGTMVKETPNSPVPLVLAFVVVRRGAEVHIVNDAHALLSVLIKVD